MKNIVQITQRDDNLSALTNLWERSVRATHDFLTNNDIVAIRPQVETGLRTIAHLYVRQADDGTILGFIGVEDAKIEMLFVDPAARGKGAGKALIQFAVSQLGADKVDVNEQNTQGVGFYLAMGFRQFARSELDGQGAPFPLLHMERTAEK